ncbi:MAG: small multi-drug export protein [Sulfolobales archaeon]
MDELMKYLFVLITSLTPGVEVRGSIPLTFILFNDGPGRLYSTCLAIAGNLLIAPIMLALLSTVDRVIRNSRNFPRKIRNLYVKVLEYVSTKSSKVRKYSFIGLLTFTAVPLPGTGAWTASLIAFIINMDRVKAIIAIEVGVLIASLLVLATTYLGLEIVKAVFLLS